MAMQMFRNFGKSITSKVLLFVLILAFAGWGINDFVTGGGGAPLTINGEKISLREIEQTHRQRVASITQMLGGTPPSAEMLAQLDVPQLVLTEVTHRHVLQQAAHRLRLSASQQELRDAVVRNPSFSDNGAFDPGLYRRMLGQMGLTPSAFEAMMTDEISVQKLAGLVTLPKPDAQGLAPLLAAGNSTYQLETFTLSPAGLPPQPAPTEEQLVQFHQANQAVYSEPEKRSIAVLTLGPDSIGSSISIADEQVEEHFNQNIDAYKKPEMRRVRHILIDDAKQAVALYNQVKAGDDFAALAREHSTDPGSKAEGGDLGNISQAEVVPEFGNAAFALEIGAVSEPVQSPFGWHIIKVESITHPAAPQLAEVRGQIRDMLLLEQTEDALQGLLKTVDDRAAGGDSLAAIAEASGLTVRRIPLLTATTSAADIDPALVQAAFMADEGSVSGPVTLSDGSLAYLEVTTLQPAKVRPLAEVHDNVRRAFLQAQTQDALNRTAMAMINAARQPQLARQPLAEVAKSIDFGGTSGSLTITDVTSAPDWLHPVLADIYQLPATGLLQMPVANGQDRVLVRLTSRQGKAPADAAAAATAYADNLQGDMENLLLSHLVGTAKLKYNATLLRQVFGANWNPPS